MGIAAIANPLFHAAFAGLLIVVAAVDLRTMRIPNKLVCGIALLWIAYIVFNAVASAAAQATALTGFFSAEPASALTAELASGLTGGFTLGGSTLVVALIMERITHRSSFGGGDIKLLFTVGLWFGFSRGTICLFLSCLAALAFAALLPRLGWKPPTSAREQLPEHKSAPESALHAPFPFAPAIAAGALATLLFF